MQVCLPRGQAACCAHAAFLKREQNCLSHSWLRQKPSPRRSPCSSSGFCRVQKEFAKAGLSAAASNKVLKKCQMYLQWDCESKLQPALQLWLQELGSEKLREVLQYAPHLLERNPADCEEVFMWLLLRIPYTGNCYKEPRKWWHTRTFGVDAALIQRKQPEVMLQKLDDVRKTIDSVRWNADFTELQLRSFLHHHWWGPCCGRPSGSCQGASASHDISRRQKNHFACSSSAVWPGCCRHRAAHVILLQQVWIPREVDGAQ